MKKIILVAFTLLSGSVFADGAYDGVWQTSVGIYATVNQNGDEIVVLTIDPSTLMSEAYLGSVVDNKATLKTVIGGATVSMLVEFQSESAAKSTILSCMPRPGFFCLFPVGFQFTSLKIF